MSSIGIDFGTTNCRVAVCYGTKITVLENDRGSRKTPSCVAFTKTGRLIGESAEREMTRNPRNAVYDVKRLLGRDNDDPAIDRDRSKWAFAINKNGSKIQIQNPLQNQESLYPEEIAATLLSSMMEIATRHIKDERANHAVITVPTSFNVAQQNAIVNAAEIAGITVLALINEPTAAAIAYVLEKQDSTSRTILIFHLGGGTCSATIAKIEGKEIDVKASCGSSILGGKDFDDKVIRHFLREVKDVEISAKLKIKLLTKAEEARKNLVISPDASITIDGFNKDEPLDANITREEFQETNKHLLKIMKIIIELALEKANLDANQIDEVVPVGGSTRTPGVRRLLTKKFPFKEKICEFVDTDEAVVEGAAAYAALISEKWPEANALSVRGYLEPEPVIRRSGPTPVSGQIKDGLLRFLDKIFSKADWYIEIACSKSPTGIPMEHVKRLKQREKEQKELRKRSSEVQADLQKLSGLTESSLDEGIREYYLKNLDQIMQKAADATTLKDLEDQQKVYATLKVNIERKIRKIEQEKETKEKVKKTASQLQTDLANLSGNVEATLEETAKEHYLKRLKTTLRKVKEAQNLDDIQGLENTYAAMYSEVLSIQKAAAEAKPGILEKVSCWFGGKPHNSAASALKTATTKGTTQETSKQRDAASSVDANQDANELNLLYHNVLKRMHHSSLGESKHLVDLLKRILGLMETEQFSGVWDLVSEFADILQAYTTDQAEQGRAGWQGEYNRCC